MEIFHRKIRRTEGEILWVRAAACGLALHLRAEGAASHQTF
jgi:hypothetical protein